MLTPYRQAEALKAQHSPTKRRCQGKTRKKMKDLLMYLKQLLLGAIPAHNHD